MMDSGDEAFMESDEEREEESEPETEGEEDEDLGIALEGERTSRQDSDDFHYQILEPDSIVEHMCEIIREVSNVVQLPATTCRILLHHFKWNKEKMIETYYEADQERLFTDARIVSPFAHRMLPSTSSGPGSSGGSCKAEVTWMATEDTCNICFQTFPIIQMTGIECGHIFCTVCWETYLTLKVMDEGQGQTIPCPAHKCQILVDDQTVMRLLKDVKVKRRYQHLITNSFVDCNKLIRWCPTADCGRAAKVGHFEVKPITCKCSSTYCFACGHEWHEPVKCRLLKLWIKKCNDDSETSNWIAANTKECPKCAVTIEKDGGCNHMTCKNSACKMEFCWLCQGPWEPHGSSWYACNRFDDAAAKNARDSQERSRAALQRYLHYCNRYMNHMQSLRFENKLYASVKVKMEQMQQQNMSWIEVQFLKQAVDALCLCRRTLMYTYVFAYYLVNNNQATIFEDNQKDLEMATEQLSEFLERDLEKENLATLKQKVQDKYRYCDNRRVALLKHCAEGNEKEWWTYNS